MGWQVVYKRKLSIISSELLAIELLINFRFNSNLEFKII